MSRTPGASCLLDVRTTAIMQDYVLSTNVCAPGASEAMARRRLTGGYLLENCQPPVCGYDRSRDMVSVLGAMIVVATVIGNLHSMPIFIPAASIEYDAGYIELCLLNAFTYLITLFTACFTNTVIDFSGHKLAALFGMILVFLGILLDSQAWDIGMLYITNLVLVGVGGGFAYAASVTLPSDLFRDKILTGVMLVNIAGSIGTIFYTWLIVETLDVLGFKWTKLMMAFIVLFFTLAVHAYPKTRLMYSGNCEPTTAKSTKIKECVYQAAADEKDDCDAQKNCLCVCVCDLRLYSDKSFILWSCLVMLAAMNFHIPYLFLVSYAETVGAQISAWYVTCYCLASIVTRCIFISNADYTFSFNRAMFQGCLMVSGIMWVVVNWATTYGWILVMCAVLGAIEGTLCIITSRVAIGTIPSAWLGGAWISSILFHAVGMFVATLFTSVIGLRTFHFYVAFMTIGVVQIIVALLATLLPSEDDEGAVGGVGGIGASNVHSNDPCAGIRGRTSYDYTKSSSAYGSSRLYESGRFTKGTATGTTNRPDYKCKCPICSKIGCIPECLPDCSPAGTLNNPGEC